MYVGVVCACMPGIRSFFAVLTPGRKLRAMTGNLKRGKFSQPSNASYKIGSKGRDVAKRQAACDIELMASAGFEDISVWQQEFERERASSFLVSME